MRILSVSIILVAELVRATVAGAAAAPAAAPTNSSTASKSVKDLFPDRAIAKGKGFEVKRSQLEDAVIGIKSAAAARNQAIPPDELAVLEQRILDQLIQTQILLSKATEADKAKGQDTSTKRWESIKTRAGTEETLNRQLKSVGMTQETLRSKMLEEATAEAVLERELKVNVSDEEVQKFYNENPARFEQPEMVRVNQILLSTRDLKTGVELPEAQKAAKRKTMESLVTRARNGEDFLKLAKEFSEDPAMKDGEDDITFPRGTGRIPPEFEAASFSLTTNQVSDVVTTQLGFHIIKLKEKLPAKKIELAKASQFITDTLKGQAVNKQLPAYMEKAKKDADVQILDEKLKPALDSAKPTPSAIKTP